MSSGAVPKGAPHHTRVANMVPGATTCCNSGGESTRESSEPLVFTVRRHRLDETMKVDLTSGFEFDVLEEVSVERGVSSDVATLGLG